MHCHWYSYRSCGYRFIASIRASSPRGSWNLQVWFVFIISGTDLEGLLRFLLEGNLLPLCSFFSRGIHIYEADVLKFASQAQSALSLFYIFEADDSRFLFLANWEMYSEYIAFWIATTIYGIVAYFQRTLPVQCNCNMMIACRFTLSRFSSIYRRHFL